MEQVQQRVQQEQLRHRDEERTSLQEQDVPWKLKYELQQQEFAKAVQEWNSREQLLLKLLRERQNTRICIDIEEMSNVFVPEPQTTHLNDQVTQIKLGTPADCVRSGDNYSYHCTVTLRVEKSPTVEEVLKDSSQTVEETPALEICEVQEPQEVSEATEIISPEPEEPATEAEAEEAKAGLEEGSISCTLNNKKKKRKKGKKKKNDEVEESSLPQDVTPEEGAEHSANVPQETDVDKSEAEPGTQDVPPESVVENVLNELEMAKDEDINTLAYVEETSQTPTVRFEDVQTASGVEMNEVQATQETFSEATAVSSTETEEPGPKVEVVPDDWFSSSVYTEEQPVTVPQETELNPTLTDAEDVPDDWFTGSGYTEIEPATVPQETELHRTPDASPDNMVQASQEVTQDTAVPTSTNISRKAKRKNKKDKNKQKHQEYYNYDNDDNDCDYGHDYEDLYLRNRKARTNLKSVQSESRDWSFEANSRKKSHRKH